MFRNTQHYTQKRFKRPTYKRPAPGHPQTPFVEVFLICSFASQPCQEECVPLAFLILTTLSSKRLERTVLHILYFSLYEIKVV